MNAPSQNSAHNERYKLHHSYIWLASLAPAPYIIFACLISFGPVAQEILYDLGWYGIDPFVFALAASVVLTLFCLVIVFAVQAISYKYIWYEFSLTEFNYYSGIFSKKRTHIPYQKIQSVNQKAGLFQRIFGVCTVDIETAGGAHNKAVKVSYILRDDAERIRREVFLRKKLLDAGMTAEEMSTYLAQHASVYAAQQPAAPVPPAGFVLQNENASQVAGAPVAPWQLENRQEKQEIYDNVLDIPANAADDLRGIFAGDAIDTGEVTYEYGLSNKELLLGALTGKSSFALVIIAVISAIASLVAFALDFNVVSEEQLVGGVQAAMEIEFVTSMVAGIMALSILGVILISWILYILGTCISYGGFKARRRGERVETEYGILSHHFSGMHINRIQSINISQSFFQRVLGYCTISYGRIGASADASSNENNSQVSQDKLIVHPCVRLEKAHEIVQNLTPEFSDLPTSDKPVAKCALRRGLIRRVLWQGIGFWMAVCATIPTLLVAMLISNEASGAYAMTSAEDGLDLALFNLVITYVYIAAACVAVFEAIGAVLWYRKSAFGYNDAYLSITNSGYSIESVITLRQKIQHVDLRTNPLQRRANVATISATNASGIGGLKVRLIDVEMQDAQDWLQWALPRNASRL